MHFSNIQLAGCLRTYQLQINVKPYRIGRIQSPDSGPMCP